MIPAFQRNGLLPEGEHLCEWPEFALRFGGTADNGRRRRLILGLARLLLLLGEAGCRLAFVDGSFVTRERYPQDFDVCFQTEGIDNNLIDSCFVELSWGRANQRRRFGGEAFPIDFLFDWKGQTVREAFARTYDGHPKGLIRLELGEITNQIVAWLDETERGGTHGTTT